MSLQTVSAIYDSGVFKPLQPINLNNHQRINLIIETKEDSLSSSYLTIEEILTLAAKRSEELRKKPRQAVIKQHQELIKALQIETISKGVEINAY